MESNLLALAWAQLWQVTLLIVVVATLVRPVARNRPHLAYALWLVVLVKCVTPPVFASPSGVFCWLLPAKHVAIVESTVMLESVQLATPREDLIIPLYPVESVPTPTAAPVPTVEAARARVAWSDWAAGGLLVWAVGASISLGLSVWRWRACFRKAKRVPCEPDLELADRVSGLARRLGLRRRVRVLVTQGRLGPAVTGVLRPTLLMPEGLLAEKTPEELKPLLAHELIHIRRGDLWAGLLQTVVLALWWFHPLVRRAVRQAMCEAERCCDEAVLAELACKPRDYARSLLGVLQYKMEWAPAPVFPGAGRIDATSKRLERIMRLGQGCRRRSPWWCWAVMVATAAVVLPGGAFVVSGERDEDETVLSPTPAEPVAPVPRVMPPMEGSAVAAGKTEGAPLPAPPAPASVPRAAAPTPYHDANITRSYPMEKILAKCQESKGTDSKKIRKAIFQRLGFDKPDGGPLRVIWTDEGMTVSAPGSLHDQIEQELAAIEKHGLGHVVIEVVCIEGESSVVDGIVDQLQVAPSAAFASGSSAAWLPAIVEDDLQDIVRRVRELEGARVLASPRLVTESGQTASIQIGSEDPYGTQDSPREAGQFGLEMRFVPTLLSTGTVRLDCDVKHTRLEPGNAAQDDGKPRQDVRLTTRHVSTGIEVALGKVTAIRSPVWQAESPMKTLFLIRLDESESELALAEGQAGGQRVWDLLGLQLEPIPEHEFHRDFDTRYRGGLRIIKIRPGSPAAEGSLKAGDVLVGLHVWETKSLKNLNFVFDRPDLKDFVPLKYYILRGGETLYGHLRLTEAAGVSASSQRAFVLVASEMVFTPKEANQPIAVAGRKSDQN